jgi:hypothetical protein
VLDEPQLRHTDLVRQEPLRPPARQRQSRLFTAGDPISEPAGTTLGAEGWLPSPINAPDAAAAQYQPASGSISYQRYDDDGRALS